MATDTSPLPINTAEVAPQSATDAAAPQTSGWAQYSAGVLMRMTVLFVCYTLSIGPMYWHWYSGKFVNGSQTVAAFYEPLWQLSHRYPWFGEWVDHYVRLWQG